ncbi:MAG: hypothetical protein M1822_009115 [Bathelium mastoideum]|nr:MAG: hypothetical protein M1822_009115 [Bathelium mastoideum]
MEMNYDNKELHAIEEELHAEILPGTEIMTDVGSHHFVKAGGSSDKVLVPQPSNDPHDPLNWSRMWKLLTITASSYVTFCQGFGPLSLAPMFPYYVIDFNCSLPDAIQFTGVCILVLGFSNFIWVPISTSFGRRPVYILSQLICLGSCIWRARAKTYGSFMGACVLNGIGAGPAETIQPAVIADIFFLHDRGYWSTLYWVVYMGSLMVAPIIAGSMSQHVGWRNFWWLNVAMIGASILLVIFGFPETKWHRLHPGEITHTSVTPPSEKAGIEESSDVEKHAPTDITVAPTTSNHDLSKISTAARDPHLGKGGPSKQQWAFLQPNAHPFQSILNDLWIPWKLFIFPIVEFSSFVVSWSCSSFLTINLTQSQALAAPPYNLSAQNVGFTNFAILVGAFIGLATAGPLSDWVSARATRKNRGIREPEMRLPAMIPYVLIMIIGNIAVSVGYQNHWPLWAIIVVGFTAAGIQVAALPAMAMTYSVDSYKPVAGSLMVSVTVNKNVWGYGFSKFITVWAMDDG